MRSSRLSVAIFISPRNQDISCCIGKHNHCNENGCPHPERLPVFFPSLPASPVFFPVLKDQIDSMEIHSALLSWNGKLFYDVDIYFHA